MKHGFVPASRRKPHMSIYPMNVQCQLHYSYIKHPHFPRPPYNFSTGVSTTSSGDLSHSKYVFCFVHSCSLYLDPLGHAMSKFQIKRAMMRRVSIQARFWPRQSREPVEKPPKADLLSPSNSDGGSCGPEPGGRSQRSGMNSMGRVK